MFRVDERKSSTLSGGTPLAMSTTLAMSSTETSAEVQHCMLLEIPHHLKSRASSAGNYKKAAQILGATMFTVDERKSSTLSGGNGRKNNPYSC